MGQATLTQSFRAFLMTKVKPYLANLMSDNRVNIFQVDAHIGEISEILHQQLIPDFKDYGLALEQFFVTTIVKPDGDKAYEKFKDIHLRQYSDVAEAKIRQQTGIIEQQTEAQKTIIEAQSLAQKRQIEGYTYQQERGYEVAEKVAANEGVGNFSNMGMGLGMMGGVAGGLGATVAGLTTQALAPIMPQGPRENMGGGFPNPAGFDTPPRLDLKPEEESPARQESPSNDVEEFTKKVAKLKVMKESGLLADEEFEEERKKLLGSL